VRQTLLNGENKTAAYMGLLQGWLDIRAMVILSLLCFIWAGRTLLGFCLLTYTFISLISSGSGQTSNEFQPFSNAGPFNNLLSLISLLHKSFSYKRHHLSTICLSASNLIKIKMSIVKVNSEDPP